MTEREPAAERHSSVDGHVSVERPSLVERRSLVGRRSPEEGGSPAERRPLTERQPRKDAVRNRAAALAAADTLFARCASTEDVTMADIAAAAGVGKGTLFRAFGDRTGLIRALYGARLEPLARAVTDGPPPLGPDTPPLERVPALLDALLCFKLDHRHLALALEGTGSDSPYQAEHYGQWHALLRGLLERVPGLDGAEFAAHALLAATRADLVEHLAGAGEVPREELRAQLAAYVGRVLGGSV